MKLKTTFNYLVAAAIVATLFSSCAKDGAIGPAGTNGATGATGPTGPLSSGNLYGYIKKFDQYNNQIYIGLSGVKINLTGNSVNLVATSDSTGKYAFDSLLTGNYQLSYSDSLFGGNQVSNQQFLGGGNSWVKNINLSAIPNYYVTSMTLQNLSDTVLVTGTMNAASPNITDVILYIGSSSATSSAPSTYQLYYTKAIAANATTFKINILHTDMVNAGFASGSTIYMACYGISPGFATNSSYEDFATGRTVFTALSALVDTASHVLP